MHAEAMQTKPLRVTLVPYDPLHRTTLEMQLSDKAVTDWLPFAYPLDTSEVDMMLEDVGVEPEGGFQFWMVEDADNPSLGYVGAIGMQATGFKHLGQLYYWVVPEYQGRGYATVMLQAVTHLLLEQWGYTRVQALVSPENAPSMRVLEKIGYVREGLLRKYFMRSFKDPGDVMDVYMYARVSSHIDG